MKANRTTLGVLGIVLAVVLFFAINLISTVALQSTRMDLTENGVFTLTEATDRVLASIEEPITLTLYASSELMDLNAQVRVYVPRVEELLRVYEARSGGKITVRRVDPQPFSSDETRAQAYGLVGIPISREGERGYFGLVGTNSVDKLETIPILNVGTGSGQELLEYDLTRVVSRLTERTEPKLGVLDGLGLFGDRNTGRVPSSAIKGLNADFELESLPIDGKVIPDDVDALLIIHPFRLTADARYAVDQFVLAGHPAMVFIDPLAEYSQPSMQNPNVPQFPASDLKPVTDAWGVEMVPDRVVGDSNMAIQTRAQGPGGRVFVGPWLPYLAIQGPAFDQQDVVTARLQAIRMSSAGALRALDGSSTTFTPMISTTTSSMLFDEKFVENRPPQATLLQQFQPSGQRQVLAARITGSVKTAYPDGPPPKDPNAQTPPADGPEPVLKPHLSESVQPINVVIVSDTDMLLDNHMQGGGQNLDFVLNTLQNLTGGDQLIGLRGRGAVFRNFDVVDRMEREGRERLQAEDQQLSNRLTEIQQQLAQMQQPLASNPDEAMAQVATVTAERDRARREAEQAEVETQSRLRQVRAEMRAEIDALDTRLRLYNVLLVPGVVVVIGILVAIWRRVRLSSYLRRRRATA